MATLIAATCLLAATWLPAARADDGTPAAAADGSSPTVATGTDTAADPASSGSDPATQGGDQSADDATAIGDQPATSQAPDAAPAGSEPTNAREGGGDSATAVTTPGDDARPPADDATRKPQDDATHESAPAASGGGQSPSTSTPSAVAAPSAPVATSAPVTTVPPDHGFASPLATSESGGLVLLPPRAAACRLCYRGLGLPGWLYAGDSGGALERHPSIQPGAAKASPLPAIALALAPDPLTAQLFRLLGGGGGGAAALLILACLAVLVGISLVEPDRGRAFRISAVTSRPSLHVRPLELPG